MNKLQRIVICLSFLPLFYKIFDISSIVIRRNVVTWDYNQKSMNILNKYDSILHKKFKFELEHAQKLSTNTFDHNTFHRFKLHQFDQNYRRENATLLMLVRNTELEGALDSMRSLEDRFNRKYRYDWTFLNDVPFTPEFIKATTAMASGKTNYAMIPSEDWDRPGWINNTKFEASLAEMEKNDVLYGNSKSYRNMCRFNSGFFFRQEILRNYDYYFRVEPNVEYYCDFPYDPFRVMREQKKKYGFVIALYEFENTVETLWDAVEEYITLDNDKDINMDTNSYNFLTDKDKIGQYEPVVDSNSDYNLCHFWSNFEIGDLNFFRSDKYIKFFEYLDSKGGFFYERWGDAPVHSIAVSLLMERDEIIHFDELGYAHAPFNTCPRSYQMRVLERCRCDANSEDNIQITPHSCLMRWWKNGGGKYFLQENGRVVT